MLILLPPSEGKSAPASGPKLSLASLGWSNLTAPRRLILTSLIDLCSSAPARALRTLGITARQASLLDVNARLRTAPTAPAIEVYSGVLYDALDFPALPLATRRRADTRVGIASALWGLVRPGDRIPAYRLSGDTRLPGLPPLAQVWSDPIARVLTQEKGVIIDLRSGIYEKLAPIPDACAERAVTVRVLQERGGKVTVVSHHNKATKGRITAGLLSLGKEPRSVDQMRTVLEDLGYRVHEGRPTRAGVTTLDVIVTDL